MSSHPLVLSSISKSYAGVAALVEVSLTAKSGEVHALLGENGAGKSTLMNVASGTTPADSGTITVSGNVITHFNPHIATELGIAFVHQHPAVLPDLTVAENILISVPGSFLTKNGTQAQTMRAMLNDFGLTVDLKERVGSLTVAQKHLLELAKAFAIDPKVLILDEPTAPLGQESVDLLFDRVKKIKETGTAVIYITHRLAEVRMIADHVTVLRDGKWRGTSKVSEITDNEVLTLIVGRNLDSTFPNKHSKSTAEKVFLNVENLSGEDFNDVSISSNKGEIIGIAGVNGNGQSELLRALAGLNEFNGNVAIGGESFGHGDLLTRTAYLPADRHGEALMMSLSVRENAAVNALKKFKKVFLISRKKETTLVLDSLTSLSVKAPSMDAAVSSLSGGNQQKIVISRALLSEPVMIIADEPTQGVDVGARAEIYQILRNAAEGGIPVIVASSDAKELEGLCDRVYVMSRGHVIQTLVGPEITETKMIDAAVRATTLKKQESAAAEAKSSSSKLMRFIKGDFVPPIILSIIMIGLGIYIQSTNNRYFSNFNISSMLLLVSALGFIAMGQTIVLLVGGMDLSIGPMAGFLLVVASFFVNDGRKPLVMAFAFVLIFIVAAVLGSLNGILIRYGKFTAVAATLTGYIGIQGASFLLRESPDGYINASVAGAIAKTVGPIPLSFVGLAIVAVVLEVTLRRSQWGMRLRAVGSSEESARRLGVNVNLTVIGAYVASALFAGVGAIMLMAELGVGDPAQGPSFTLQSITAVVLGGTSLLGGRGSFVGTLFGSMLMIQVLNACLFLSLSQSWQYIFQGTLVIGAAIIYTKTRSSKRR